MTRIILVRHGETEWNRDERFRGRADIPLNDNGVIQARATAKRVAAEFSPAAIYSSPLVRALKTATILGEHLSLVVKLDEGLFDIDYGMWTGLTREKVQNRWPVDLSAWFECPNQAEIPGGENLDHVRRRAMATVAKIVGNHVGEEVVVVGHTVVNRLILLGVLGLGNERFWRVRQDNCAINVIEAANGDYTLVSMNETCHLK